MPRSAARLLVFSTSAAVLVLEILAGRMLAPYVGVTLETFTGIIGTVLAGIAAGSWVGGRAADRHEPKAMLGPLLVAGGVLALAAPAIVDRIGPSLRGGGPLEIVALSFLGFFAPAAVLSAVTPTVIKVQLASLAETGTVVGQLSAFGTAGAILGTFATGFVLLAALPTRRIVLVVGALLVVAGFVVAWWLKQQSVPLGVLAAAGFALAASLLTAGPCEHETVYYCARVVPDPLRDTGRTLWLDTLRHSYVDLADPTYLEFSYAQTIADVIESHAPAGEPLDVLHVGGGGFSLPGYLAATRPGTTSIVLELDRALVDLAGDELGLTTGPDLEVRVGDARLTADELGTRTFDLVIGDAFGGLAVPWHLTTEEFLEGVASRLRPGGVYVMNLIDYPTLGFLRSEAATFREVFADVALLAPPDRIRGQRGGNFILVGSTGSIDIEAILERNAARGDDEAAATGSELDDLIGDATPLTDDFAPVDQLLTVRP